MPAILRAASALVLASSLAACSQPEIELPLMLTCGTKAPKSWAEGEVLFDFTGKPSKMILPAKQVIVTGASKAVSKSERSMSGDVSLDTRTGRITRMPPSTMTLKALSHKNGVFEVLAGDARLQEKLQCREG